MMINPAWWEKDKRALWMRRLERIGIEDTATYDGVSITRLSQVRYRLLINRDLWTEIGSERDTVSKAWDKVISWLLNPTPYQPVSETPRQAAKRMPKSVFFGVYRASGGYMVAIYNRDGSRVYIGYRKEETEAARLYNEYVTSNNLDRPLNQLPEQQERIA